MKVEQLCMPGLDLGSHVGMMSPAVENRSHLGCLGNGQEAACRQHGPKLEANQARAGRNCWRRLAREEGQRQQFETDLLRWESAVDAWEFCEFKFEAITTALPSTRKALPCATVAAV